MNIRQVLTRFELAIQAAGTSEGANKGWDSRGRGRGKKNFTPPSSVVNKDKGEEPHHGAVCNNCGRTVSMNEYTSGESKCCKNDVVSEEEYGNKDTTDYKNFGKGAKSQKPWGYS